MADEKTNKDEMDFAKPTFEGGIFGNPKSFKSWINPPSFSSAASWGNLCRWIFCEKNMAKIPKDKVWNFAIILIEAKHFRKSFKEPCRCKNQCFLSIQNWVPLGSVMPLFLFKLMDFLFSLIRFGF